MSRRKHSFLSIALKLNLKLSFPPKLGRIGGNRIGFNKSFTKTLKIPIYIAIYFKIWF